MTERRGDNDRTNRKKNAELEKKSDMEMKINWEPFVSENKVKLKKI